MGLCLEGFKQGRAPTRGQSPQREAKDINDHLQKTRCQNTHLFRWAQTGANPPTGAVPPEILSST